MSTPLLCSSRDRNGAGADGEDGVWAGFLGMVRNHSGFTGPALVSAPDLVQDLRPARKEMGPQSRSVQLGFALCPGSCWISLEIFL